MRAGYKAAVSISILLLLSSFIFIPAEEISADEYSIELLNEDGSKVDPDTPLISKLLTFVTYTDEHGTRYFLEKETVLTEKTFYLRINAQSGSFHVTASVPSADITGSLHKAGMEIRLVNGEDDFAAVLNTNDNFDSLFNDDSGTAVFKPNILYKLTILTAHGIEGDSQVERTPDFTLRFETTPLDSYTVVFEDDGIVIETRMVAKDTAIGELPDPPARTGAEFKGWFGIDDNQWKATDIVTKNMILHTKWERGPLPPDPPDPPVPPGPTPPKPDEKETKEEEVIIEPDGTEITIISDLIERSDGTYDL